ncbi:MAG: VWA domain-containing protein [Caldilineaceae bacterium]|nr:VWA domain-containing protein [Caldilineaceae bacterium]
MSFIWPTMLFSLLVVPVLVALYVRNQRRRRQIAERYGSLGFVQASSGPSSLGRRRHVPALLFLVGLIALLVALARPQAVVSLPRLQGTIVLAFDVSGSMGATDMEPSRMEAAKAAATEFVLRQPSTVRIGVVAFSDGGLPVLAPTNNQDEVLAAIARMGPERGTSLGQGILLAVDSVFARNEPPPIYSNLTPEPTATPEPVPAGSFRSAAIVMLTDGENTAPPDPFEAAQIAADRGVRIYPIGIGSSEGAVLEVEGFQVFTRLDEGTLQGIAALTEGSYFNAVDEEELSAVYAALEPQLTIEADPMEVTSLFAGVSILLLIIGGALSMLWFGRVP